MVSINVLYICKTASLRCVAKHRNSNGPNVPVWLHESYIIFPHSTLSSFTVFSCARPPEENLGRIPESLHELMKPENRHFLDELHEEAWEVRWSRLEVDAFFRDFLLGKRRQVNLESIFFSPSNHMEGGFAGGSQSHL